MRLRKRALAIPLLALLGILLAIFLLWRKKPADFPPAEISVPSPAVPLPAPAAKNTQTPEPDVRDRVAVPAAPMDPEEARRVQTEMKISLAAMYGAEKSFYSEYHRYSTDLSAIGYWPDLGSTLKVKVGFLHPYTPADPLPNERPEVMTTEELKDNKYNYTPEAQAAHLEDAARYCHNGCTASDSRFEIAVATTTNGQLDVWTITQDKVMTHETAAEGK